VRTHSLEKHSHSQIKMKVCTHPQVSFQLKFFEINLTK
jgi:hypothetical protein